MIETPRRFDLDQRVGDPFIKRPAFVVGTRFKTILNPVMPDFPIQKRALDVEGRLRRRSFKLTGPAPRPSTSIQEIEDLKTRQQGIKVRLGPGQFGKVRVAKRDRDGNVIKDEEGNIVYELKEFDLSMATLPLQDRLELLQDALLTGIGERMNDVSILLASILGSDADVKKLTGRNLKMLSQVVDDASVASGEASAEILNPADDFPDIIEGRFITKKMWKDNNNNLTTRVRTWLLRRGAWNISPQLSQENPLFGSGTGRFGLRNTISVGALDSQMGIGNVVMDLEGRRLFKDMATAREEAGERAASDAFASQRRSAAADDDESKHDDADPTAAQATVVSQTITSAQADPSAPGSQQALRLGVTQQSRAAAAVAPSTVGRFPTFFERTPTAAIPAPPTTAAPPTPTAAVAALLLKRLENIPINQITTAQLKLLTDSQRRELADSKILDTGSEEAEAIRRGISIPDMKRRRAAGESFVI